MHVLRLLAALPLCKPRPQRLSPQRHAASHLQVHLQPSVSGVFTQAPRRPSLADKLALHDAADATAEMTDQEPDAADAVVRAKIKCIWEWPPFDA